MELSNFLYSIFHFVQIIISFISGGTFCNVCGKRCCSVPLCKDCKKRLFNYIPFTDELRCVRCGKILVSESRYCSKCRELKDSGSVKRFFPVQPYRTWKKDLMFSWKSEDQRMLSYVFAELINNAFKSIQKEHNLEIDSIVGVPPRKGKLRKKGWDQIDELCRILKRKYGFRIESVLERYTSAEQKFMTKAERKGSKGAMYGLKNGVNLTGKSVLILDDVITTGSTMEKCALLLRKAGAKEVYGISLFIVD